MVRTSYGIRPIIEQSSYDLYISTDDRPSIDRSPYDYRLIIVRWHTGYEYRWPISKFLKHMSVGYRQMIGRGPVADQKLLRCAPSCLSNLFLRCSDIEEILRFPNIIRRPEGMRQMHKQVPIRIRSQLYCVSLGVIDKLLYM